MSSDIDAVQNYSDVSIPQPVCANYNCIEFSIAVTLHLNYDRFKC